MSLLKKNKTIMMSKGKTKQRENCCWICEGWQEQFLKIDLLQMLPDLEMTDNVKDDHYNVFVHMDFDGWEPDLMEDLRKKNKKMKGLFQGYRMVPTGVCYYFYSYNGRAFVNPNEPSRDID